MKKKNLFGIATTALFVALLFSSIILAQEEPKQEKNQVKNQFKINSQLQHGNKFIDLNGDGYNDNAPDADGDGILNGRDGDYAGAKFRKGNNGTKGFIDLNGDGINDNAIDSDGDGIPNGQDPDFVRPQDGTGRKMMNGKINQNKFGGNKYGPGNGTGNSGIGPKDGTGYGTKYGAGTGNCDGTGPKGKRGGRR